MTLSHLETETTARS